MDQPYYLGAALVAIGATAMYLYRPTERVPVSGSVAMLLWGWLALQGGDVSVIDDTGATASVPVPDELRFIMAILSALSLAAVVLYGIGAYPPELEGADEPGTTRYAAGARADGGDDRRQQ
jgi:hypothetical protein